MTVGEMGEDFFVILKGKLEVLDPDEKVRPAAFTRCLAAACPLPAHCLPTACPLPFLDLSLPFHCLSLAFHCLSLAFH